MSGRLSGTPRLIAAAVWITALTLPAMAGDIEAPKSVETDYRGDFEIVILVTGTDDPMFQLTRVDNVSTSEIRVLRTGDRAFRIEIRGRLINLRRDGSLSFRADPEGRFVDGKVVVRPSVLSGIRAVRGNLVVPWLEGASLIECNYKCSKDAGTWTMACVTENSPAACCALVREAGCPDGSTFQSGDCAGTSC